MEKQHERYDVSNNNNDNRNTNNENKFTNGRNKINPTSGKHLLFITLSYKVQQDEKVIQLFNAALHKSLPKNRSIVY